MGNETNKDNVEVFDFVDLFAGTGITFTEVSKEELLEMYSRKSMKTEDKETGTEIIKEEF